MSLVIEGGCVKGFAFDIFLPDETSSRFWLSHDLAGLFGDEYNAESVKKLRAALRAAPDNPRGRVDIDWEADAVSAGAAKPDAMLILVRTINSLCKPQHRLDFDSHRARLSDLLTTWERPRPRRFRAADIVAIPLRDGSFGYAQLLDGAAGTLAVFSRRDDARLTDVAPLARTPVIAVLHVVPHEVAHGIWPVLGTMALVTQSSAVSEPEMSRTGGLVTWMLEAWFGLSPCNTPDNAKALMNPQEFRRMLLPGVTSPPTVWIASPAEFAQFVAAQPRPSRS